MEYMVWKEYTNKYYCSDICWLIQLSTWE